MPRRVDRKSYPPCSFGRQLAEGHERGIRGPPRFHSVAWVAARPAGSAGFVSLDLVSVLNRPHDSMMVGGGDNASFKTWFSGERVEVEGVPFLVERTGSDVLVSANNTENVFELQGVDSSAEGVHFLIWGYNLPEAPAKLVITFENDTTQECELPLEEWTNPQSPPAFDFENTVGGFQHAAIFSESVKVAHPKKKIRSIASSSGLYGLIAITLEE